MKTSPNSRRPFRFHPLGVGLITVGLVFLGSILAFRLDQPARQYTPEQHSMSFRLNAPVAKVFGGVFILCGVILLIAKRHQDLDRSERGLSNPPQPH